MIFFLNFHFEVEKLKICMTHRQPHLLGINLTLVVFTLYLPGHTICGLVFNPSERKASIIQKLS